tara:strand:+ start:391 stop:1338 length:948 start_codon:yes stop_codon:yes gene_type:complete
MKTLQVALAQIAPVWSNKKKTFDKIKDTMLQAVKEKAQLIVFGEGLLPGYPFWLALTDGAQWDLKINKSLHAHYAQNAVNIEDGDIEDLCVLAKEHTMAVYLGVIERATNRGGHSLYCSLVYINEQGTICSVHRKLQPTYDERLTWASGDGNGLQVHPLEGFTVGGLNCWENWMPLPRAALYGMGENVHCAVWPGSDHNTKDITRFIARESRSYVISVSSLMNKTDFPKDTPYIEELLAAAPEQLANGGSCVANPDGSWLIEPQVNIEGVFCAEILLDRVYEERQNFDPVGHYSRPDVTQLHINRERQSTVKIKD